MKFRESTGKVSVSNFDAKWYTTTYPDCLATSLSPSEHYEKIGRLLGRAPCSAESKSNAGQNRGKRPKVSVLCITYNHEKYIESTLQGFCRQKTKFDVEFIVADDCSTDGTAAIIQRYAELDKRIVPIFHKKNLGVAGNFESAAAKVKGEYVALCEGDDYWTDPNKLQRQVDQLDQDRDLTIVFHPVEVFNDADGKIEYFYPDSKPDLTIWELIHNNFIQTNSVMYRWRFSDGLPDWFDSSILPLDWFLHLCHAEVGKIGYLPDIMAKYRKHDGGIWSSAAADEPIKLWRRYGREQLKLFDSVAKVAGGLFSDHTNHTFDYLLKEIFLDALVTDNTEIICQLVQDYEAALVRLDLLSSSTLDNTSARVSDAIIKRVASSTRVSVIVLTYNHSRYIKQSLASVLQQKGPFELEVIIGDDHSTDDTVAQIEKMSKGRGNVKVLSSAKNIGMLANMRRCLAACTGDFIAFCEGDDYWLGDRKLIRQAALMKRDPKLALSFNWVLLEHELDGQMLPHPEQAQQHQFVPTSVIARSPLTANFSCCMYRSEAVKTIPDSYFEDKTNADWMFNMYAAEWGGIAFLKEIHSVYRLHSKGQWTGLSQSSQSNLFAGARQKCSELIGPARGFDDYKVTCSVEERHGLEDGRFAFSIDQPRNGSREFLESGRFNISGWAVDSRGKPLSIKLTNGVSTLIGETDVLRADASRAVGKKTGAYYSPLCGFNLRPQFDLINSKWELFILCDDKEYKVVTINAFISHDADHK